jgi:aryl-alcohol dehydrogenase-like predicted oxidoreductase
MEYRFLGRSGLQVSAISLGGWLTYGGHIENGQPRIFTNWHEELLTQGQRERLHA